MLSQSYYDNVLLNKLLFDVYKVVADGDDKLIGTYSYTELTAGIDVDANEQYYIDMLNECLAW